MPLATCHSAAPPRARRRSVSALMAPPNASSSQQIIRIRRFCQMPCIHGDRRGVTCPQSHFGSSKMNFFENNRGAAAVEFSLVALPVIGFIIGIILFAWAVWIDNLLHIAVDTVSRCGAVGSTTSPCDGAGPVDGGSTANLISTAATMFQPLTPDATTFKDNTDCSVDAGTGLQGTGVKGSYHISVGLGVFSINLTVNANSCYPTVPPVTS